MTLLLIFSEAGTTSPAVGSASGSGAAAAVGRGVLGPAQKLTRAKQRSFELEPKRRATRFRAKERLYEYVSTRTEIEPEIEKQSAEQRPYTVDFSLRLPEGVTIASCTLSAFNVFGLAADNAILQSTTGTLSADFKKATAIILGGISGQDYTVTFRANCSDSDIIEQDILLLVRDL